MCTLEAVFCEREVLTRVFREILRAEALRMTRGRARGNEGILRSLELPSE